MESFFVLGCYCPAEINRGVKIMRHGSRKIRLMWWSDIWLTNIKVVQRSIVEGVSWGKRRKAKTGYAFITQDGRLPRRPVDVAVGMI